MKKIVLTLALPMVLLSNAQASEWQDILKAANNAASPKTKQAINNILHNVKLHPQQGTQTVQPNQLTDVLMKGAGVTQAQAQGGAGALLQLAQNKMQADDFAKLAQAIPNLPSLLSAVPALQQPSTLNSLTKLAGNSGGTVSNLLTVVSIFQQLGISPAQMQQFLPLLLDYVNTTQGASLAQLLGSAILN
jgi:opacity protein-like surface antigen